MGAILRGYTAIENKPNIQSVEINLVVKDSKNGRAVFIVDISSKGFDDFEVQIGDAIEFLKSNELALAKLKSKLPDLYWDIDFDYSPKITTGQLALEGLNLPVELLALCSKLNIALLVSLYDGRLFSS